jgi:hypothetical protein
MEPSLGGRGVNPRSPDVCIAYLDRFGFRGWAQRDSQKVWHDARDSRNKERHCLDDAKHHSHETEGEHESPRPSIDAAR